uniref:GCR448 n=1 Tax=Schmidtea mediterranea TaxID=79327 RepID=A0A193KUH9_SCHMD|nr:GCR448 [Schmidtea mediterranea]
MCCTLINTGKEYKDQLKHFCENITTFRDQICLNSKDSYAITFEISIFKLINLLFYIILFTVGIFGNLLILVCIFSLKHMRTISNMFLANLAISDLFIFLICQPLSLTTIIYSSWVFGEKFCKLQGLLQGTNLGVSILSLLGLNIERYVAVRKMRFGNQLYRRKLCIMYIIGIWCIAGSISLPLAFSTELKKGIDKKQYCLETWWGTIFWKQFYTIMLFLVLYAFPLLSMIILYYLILTKVKNSMKQQTFTTNHSTRNYVTRLRTQRTRISKVSTALVCLFTICWLPYHIVNIYADFQILNENQTKVYYLINYGYPIVQWLVYSNSAINPLSTIFISQKFRFAVFQVKQRRFNSRSTFQ